MKLSTENAKTPKGEKYGWRTAVLYLAPHSLSGFDVCQYSSPGCRAACLYSAGRGQMLNVQKARLEKTRQFFTDRRGFMADLEKAIIRESRRARRDGLQFCLRLNGTSDIPWHRVRHYSADGTQWESIIHRFPEIQCYDYTKRPPGLWGNVPPNYHLTFSWSESAGDDLAALALDQGISVAKVFHTVPKTHYIGGKRRLVVDGDSHDLRFLDHGRLIGLRAKGQAKYDIRGFVQ